MNAQTVAQIWAFIISDAGQRLLQNVIAITALIFAIRGVRNWNRERLDLRRAELAEKTLAVARKAFDVFMLVRWPEGHGGEGASRKRGEGETAEISAGLDAAFVPIERLNTNRELFEEIKALRYSISAAFGLEAAAPLLVFLSIHNEIAGAASARMRDVLRPPRRMDEKAIARSDRLDAVIWAGYADNEEIIPRLEAAIAELERQFRPYVEATFRRFTTRFFRRSRKA